MFHVPLAATVDDLYAVDVDDLIALHAQVGHLSAERERQAARG